MTTLLAQVWCWRRFVDRPVRRHCGGGGRGRLRRRRGVGDGHDHHEHKHNLNLDNHNTIPCASGCLWGPAWFHPATWRRGRAHVQRGGERRGQPGVDGRRAEEGRGRGDAQEGWQAHLQLEVSSSYQV